MNITDPISYLARVKPNAIAVIRADGVGVSFGEFDRLIDATASVLPDFGIAAGQVVGLTITWPDQFPGLVTALALARLGAVSAPIALPPEHLSVCITEPGGPPARPELRSVANQEVWSRAQRAAAEAAAVASHPGGSAIVRIFSTSGTTGVPKFVAISHDLMSARLKLAFLYLGRGDAVRHVLVGLGIYYGFIMALYTLWGAGTLVLALPDPAHVLAALGQHGVTLLDTTPIMLSELVAEVERGTPAPPALKEIEVAGSTLPDPVRAKAEQLLCSRLVSMYGATENGLVAAAPLAELPGDPSAVGFVVPGMELEAIDADGRRLPPGREGVLRIRGPEISTGYFADEAASREVFRDGWFHPGDVGSVSAEGILRITGRVGEVINVGGNKISPRVIEDVLLSFSKVTDAAAFGVPDELGFVQIWAAIVAAEPISRPELMAFCHERLRDKAPKFVLQLPRLPRNANGKVMVRELLEAALVQKRDARSA